MEQITAENAAVICSLMGCCKARESLVYVLENIHGYDMDYSKDLAELLPHNWIGNQKNLKNTKSHLNVLPVFQREIKKLAKVR